MPLLSNHLTDAAMLSALGAMVPSVKTVEALLERDLEQLARECRAQREAVVEARLQVARSVLGGRRGRVDLHVAGGVFETAYDASRRQGSGGDGTDGSALSSGVEALDELLGRGGFARGELSELEGPTCSGKTQLGLTVAALAAARGGTVLWIDAGTCAFSAQRLREIVAARCDDDSALDRVTCASVFDATDLLKLLDDLRTGSSAISCDSLVVVDSPCAVLAPNLGNCSLGHAVLARVAKALSQLAVSRDLVVLTMNATVRLGADSNTAGGSRFGDVWKGALGLAWTYAATTRLSLASPMEGRRRAALTKHPLKEDPTIANFTIGRLGCDKAAL